jgi:2,3,4,5-tetrahydropyridine-2-carboxylate N-succinyltransferase
MISYTEQQKIIESSWEERDTITPNTQGALRAAVDGVLSALDQGRLRVASPEGETWKVHDWIKKAVLLYFRLNPMRELGGGVKDALYGDAKWYDKVPSKFAGWSADAFQNAGFRAVPPCTVRFGAYIAPQVVLLPSFVNIGAFVDRGTMIDTWATVGSCAQIGKDCHISGGAGIGGVLEPLQAAPVIIEDNCFIGARAEVAEGVRVGRGSVLGMGVYLGASTKIVDRATGEIFMGYVPPYSVVVAGTLPAADPKKPSLYCAVIVKRVDEKTRAKTSLNELLRGD